MSSDSRPLVAVDIDGVLCDFIGPVVAKVNDLTGENYTVDDVTTFQAYDALRVPKKQRREADAHVRTKNFCRDLKPYPGALDFLAELRAFADVVALTAPFNSDHWHREREWWLVHDAGFAHADVVFAHSVQKPRYDADALVDDRASTVNEWSERRAGVPILLSRPWNRDEELAPRVVRANDLQHAVALLRSMLESPRPTEQGKQTEVGWLVENPGLIATGPCWWNGKYWTTDASSALRFSREQDAHRYVYCNLQDMSGVVVTQHAWSD